MSGTISHLRRLAVVLGRRCCFQAGSSQMYPVIRYSNKLGHGLNMLQKCGLFSSTNVKQHMSPKEVAEERATETLENLNKVEKQRLENLKIEYHIWKDEEDCTVPDVMTNEYWVVLLRLETTKSRKKFYKFLRKREFYILADKQQREMKKAVAEKFLKPIDPEIGINTFIGNTQSLMKWRRKYQGCHAFLSEDHLVFDLAVREQSHFESRKLVRQLNHCYSINRQHPEAFHLHFTGIPETGPLADIIESNFLSQEYFIDYHKEDLCDVFPAERLVYMTPHCKTNMDKYNPDDIYVIGGLVDLHDTTAYSHIKAQKLGIRSACLPLDKYYRLKKTKTLTLEAVLAVLLEMKISHDMEKAMRHIPARYWDMIRIGV